MELEKIDLQGMRVGGDQSDALAGVRLELLTPFIVQTLA